MENKEKDTEKVKESSEKSENPEKKPQQHKSSGKQSGSGKKPAQHKSGKSGSDGGKKTSQPKAADKKPAQSKSSEHTEKKPAHTETAKAETAAEKAAEAEPAKKKKKRFTKKRELAIIALSLALAFTVCFFVPADTFIANQNDFIISAPRVLLPILGVALGASAALILILNACLAINVKLWKIVESLLGGVLIAGYWQVMFANGKMVQITGDPTTYSERSSANNLNLLLFFAIMLLPLIVLIISGELKKGKRKRYLFTALTYISAIIFLMQCVGLGSRVIKTGILRKDDSGLDNYLSMEDTMNLSKDNNVVVFLTDRLDAHWMEMELDYYPEIADELEGFTFYSNNVGRFTNTFPSVCNMLTNYEYSGQDWADYFDAAWQGETLPKRLHDNGYKVNLLIDSLVTYSDFDDIRNQCDNIHSSVDLVDFNYFGSGGILRTIGKFSLGKLAPYLLKNNFLGDMTSDFSSNFYTATGQDAAAFKGIVGNDTDMDFCNYVRTHQMKSDCDQKTFTFIHLNFAHDYSEDLAALDPDYDGNIDREKNMRGGFILLNYYLDKMKEAGVYDNSTIIFIGDHGRPPAEIEYAEDDELPTIELDGEIRTTVLIKPAGAERKPLVIDHDAELSSSEFAATVLEYADVDKSGFGPSFMDVKEMDEDDIPERILHVYFWKGIGRVDDILKYEVTGDASDFNNWKVIERFGVPTDN
ncbi:MAG: sulfatase-like hydrolase/transferase [Ruminococcus sp.]|nr:sulfatase-like hydrolase/transferase [Ruminococcus sp.]